MPQGNDKTLSELVTEVNNKNKEFTKLFIDVEKKLKELDGEPAAQSEVGKFISSVKISNPDQDYHDLTIKILDFIHINLTIGADPYKEITLKKSTNYDKIRDAENKLDKIEREYGNLVED